MSHPLKGRNGHSSVASLTRWRNLGPSVARTQEGQGGGAGCGEAPVWGKVHILSGLHTWARAVKNTFYGDSARSGQNSSLCKQLGIGGAGSGQRSQETSWRLKDQVGFFTQ